MVQEDYGIIRKPTSVRNPRANSILERIHQTMGSIIRTFSLSNKDDLVQGDPWDGVLAATMFALRATYHTTLQATPTQLMFGRDAILNIKYKADWAAIKARKEKLIAKNNGTENKKSKQHEYHEGDKILIKNEMKSKYANDPYSGPYEII